MTGVKITPEVVPGLLRLLSEQANGREAELAQYAGTGLIVRFRADDGTTDTFSVMGSVYNHCTFTPESEEAFANLFVPQVPSMSAICDMVGSSGRAAVLPPLEMRRRV